MSLLRTWGIFWLLGLACQPAALLAQAGQIRNPYTSPADVAAGARIFRSHCAICHGLDGTGGKGPDLTRGEFRHGSSDGSLLDTISNGVAGTEMPGIFFTENQLWQVVSFVRSLSSSAVRQKVPGDPAAGQRIFRGKGSCGSCHRINGQGGRLGPDLSDIGFLRSPTHLRTSILKPSETIHPGYRRVRIVTRDGKTLLGFRLNEDTYSIRIMDLQENLLSLSTQELKETREEPTSSMPSYDGVLAADELEHLVAYLYSLRRKAAP